MPYYTERGGKIVVSRSGFSEHYSALRPEFEYCPVIGGHFSRPELIVVKQFSEDFIWQKYPKKYGLDKNQTLPPLPSNFLPTLFNDESYVNLISATYQKGRSSIKLNEMDFVVHGFRETDTAKFFPWDAGLLLKISYGEDVLSILGPALVSFDHPILRFQPESSLGLREAENIVRTHLFELSVGFSNGVVIHMPNLNNYSVTGSYLSSQQYYRHESFSIDSKEFDLHMFVGDASLDETAEPISPNVFKELSENIDFITLMIKLSTAWNSNFKREIAKWPARYSEASKKLSLEMIEHLSKEMKKIKFTD